MNINRFKLFLGPVGFFSSKQLFQFIIFIKISVIDNRVYKIRVVMVRISYFPVLFAAKNGQHAVLLG